MTRPVTFFLLRGLAREIRHWLDFPEKLEHTGTENRSVPLEIPGAGRLRTMQAPLHITGYLPPLRQQYLQHVRENRENILIGLSLGGMIAAQWVHDHPGDFSKVVLINTSSAASSFLERLQPGAAAALLSAAARRDCRQQELKIAELICNIADADRIADRWAAICRDAPMKTTNKLRQLAAAARFTLPAQPDVPALVLCAENDRLAAHTCSEEIARRWKAKLACHDRAGHDLPTDAPDWCVDTILSWHRNHSALS